MLHSLKRKCSPTMDGVIAVGQFDVTGMYFSELKSSKAYQEINSKVIAESKYASYK